MLTQQTRTFIVLMVSGMAVIVLMVIVTVASGMRSRLLLMRVSCVMAVSAGMLDDHITVLIGPRRAIALMIESVQCISTDGNQAISEEHTQRADLADAVKHTIVDTAKSCLRGSFEGPTGGDGAGADEASQVAIVKILKKKQPLIVPGDCSVSCLDSTKDAGRPRFHIAPNVDSRRPSRAASA
jgi:hypothetical protein